MSTSSRFPTHHIPDTGGIVLQPEVKCPVPKGSVIIHDGCTLHRSDLNRTATWRRARWRRFSPASGLPVRNDRTPARG